MKSVPLHNKPLPDAVKPPFTVPNGYFNGLSSRIAQRLEAESQEEEPTLSIGVVGMPLTVAEDAFAKQKEEILAQVKLLNVAEKHPFAAPTGYEARLKAAIMAKTVGELTIEENRIVQIHWWKEYRQYVAVAATLLVLVGIGWWMVPKEVAGNDPIATSLQKKAAPVEATNIEDLELNEQLVSDYTDLYQMSGHEMAEVMESKGVYGMLMREVQQDALPKIGKSEEEELDIWLEVYPLGEYEI